MSTLTKEDQRAREGQSPTGRICGWCAAPATANLSRSAWQLTPGTSFAFLPGSRRVRSEIRYGPRWDEVAEGLGWAAPLVPAARGCCADCAYLLAFASKERGDYPQYSVEKVIEIIVDLLPIPLPVIEDPQGPTIQGQALGLWKLDWEKRPNGEPYGPPVRVVRLAATWHGAIFIEPRLDGKFLWAWRVVIPWKPHQTGPSGPASGGHSTGLAESFPEALRLADEEGHEVKAAGEILDPQEAAPWHGFDL